MVCAMTDFQDLQSRDEMPHCLTANFGCLMRSQHNLPRVVMVVLSYHYLTELVVVYTTDTSWQCVLVYDKVGNNKVGSLWSIIAVVVLGCAIVASLS